MLFSYRVAYKVAIRYTPYQLMCGLYLMIVVGGNQRDNTSMKVLISIIIKLEKLQEIRMHAIKTT
jgi:hypothetical protein